MTSKGDLPHDTAPHDPEPTVAEPGRARRTDATTRPEVAGYTLEKILGRGGMGIVWEALEHRLDRRVALKVHSTLGEPERVARMWSEARLAAKVSDPGVVPVHDFGLTLEGEPFYTMELVEGTDLRALLREAPLPRTRALELAGQIASAVGAAHERGIVHRDLKPSNVLIDAGGRARVLDFGLAYDPTLADAYADMMAGTPAYMAPEQITGAPVGPPADVHAIGVLLYEMLTGARPWQGQGREILEHIRTEPPVPPSTRNPSVGADVEEVCLRCLARNPDERFPTARALAGALEALRLGKAHASQTSRAPARKASDGPPVSGDPERLERDRAPLHHRWTWTLASSPEALWPHVSNTDRVNRAIGLQAVDFTDSVDDDDAGTTRRGAFHLFGMGIEWREHPFEWLIAREHSVFRRYQKGPLEALWNAVTLSPAAGGGTELVHEIWVKPRGLVGRVTAFMEVERKTGRNLDRLYRRIDECLREGKGADPFEPPHEPTAQQTLQADTAARRLVQRGFDPPLVERLRSFVLFEPVKRLERMRPYELADAWGVDRPGMLDLCLHAAYAGMLELSWDAICPRCRIAHESFETLGNVASGAGTCIPCGTSYERDLADSVEVVFRPHPQVRLASPTTYCAGAPALRPHVLVQQRLAPGERRVVHVALPVDDYGLSADWPGRSFEVCASGAGFLSQCEVAVREGTIDARPAVLRAGPVELAITNETEHEQLVRVEALGARDDAVMATAVMTHPSFRECFGDELLSEKDPMAVRRMAFLCLEVEGRAKLFAERGDAGAWAALRRLDGIVGEAILAHRGVIVPAPLGVYAIAFSDPAGAVEAAIAVLTGWHDEGSSGAVRAAVHEGPCIAVTRERRVEYFGKTVHRALMLLDDAAPGVVALSDAVASERDVAARIHALGLRCDVTRSERGPYAGLRIARLRVGGGASHAHAAGIVAPV